MGIWRSVGHSYNAFFTESFVDEAAAAVAQRLDAEAVLAVEETADDEVADPAELPFTFCGEHCRLEAHRPGVRRLDADLEDGSGMEIAVELAHERVPLGVGGRVREDRPDGGRWRVDLDRLLNCPLRGHWAPFLLDLANSVSHTS